MFACRGRSNQGSQNRGKLNLTNRLLLGTVTLDDKYRVLLDRKTREIAGINKRDKLVTFPFKGGEILVAPSGHKFQGSLTDFGFAEKRHEASRFIFRRKN